MSKAVFFIDGFNVYHCLKERRNLHQYLWLNYWALAENIKRRADTVVKVFYFSAIKDPRSESSKRHTKYIRALEANGVFKVLGKFKHKDKVVCRGCGRTWEWNEEKQTDINIAITMIKEAAKETFDAAYLVSGDSDLVPAVRFIKEAFPKKEVGVVFPLGRSRYSKELDDVADFSRRLSEDHFKRSQLPDEVSLESGAKLKRPSTWS